MPRSLKNHPFAVEAFFKSSLVLTYSVNKNSLKDLIPKCLQLDMWKDQYAFLAAAFVETSSLRPKGFPEFLGSDFFLVGYRIFVKYIDRRGKRLRGLYILRSETDKKLMSLLGNVFTHYNYCTTDISFTRMGSEIFISSEKSDLNIQVKVNGPDISLPKESPFADWKEARRFAGPLPFTFSYNSASKEVLTIEGVRENWNPGPVEVVKENIGFVRQERFKDIILASAFVTENIPYYWKKGRIEIWKG